MPKINSYTIKTAPLSRQDKWIGTDSSGNVTKNFTPEGVGEIINRTDIITVSGQSMFFWQGSAGTREEGSMSFPGFGGDGSNLADLTSFMISTKNIAGNLVIDYLLTMIGSEILLTQEGEPNTFLIATLASLTVNVGDPNFYDALIVVQKANGTLTDEANYGLTKYAGSGAGGGGGQWIDVTGGISYAAGGVVIGDTVVSSDSKLHVKGTSISDGSNIGSRLSITRTPQVNNGGVHSYGGFNAFVVDGDYADYHTTAYYARLNYTGSAGNTGWGTGITGKAYFEGTGTAGSPGIYGMKANAYYEDTGSTGNVTYLIGNNVKTFMNSSTGSVTWLQGQHVSVGLNAGTVNGGVQVVLVDFDYAGGQINGDFAKVQIQADPYDYDSFVTGFKRSINNESTLPSYFAGSIGIGVENPIRMLSVESTSSSMVADFRSSSGNDSFISFSNNTSTADKVRLGSRSNNLVLSTNYTPRLTIDNSGNVGINTESPDTRLHVRGDIKSAGGTYNTVYGDTNITASNHFIVTTQSYMRFSSQGNLDLNATVDIKFSDTSGNELMRLDTNGANKGNLGIGTNTPLTRLDVVGELTLRGTNNLTIGSTGSGGDFSLSSGIRGYKFANQNGDLLTIDSAGAIQFNNYGTGANTGTLAYKLGVDASGNIIETAVGAGSVDGSGTANYIARWTDADTLGIGLLYDSGSRIGIGTSTPNSALDIQRPGADIRLTDTNGGSRAILQNLLGNFVIDKLGNEDVLIKTNGFERLRVLGSGNVGIGTTSPSEKLQVAGNIEIGANNSIKSSTRTSILLDRSTDARMIFNSLYTSSTTGGFEFNTGASTKLLIRGDGNVGIGTTSPNNKLHLVDNTDYALRVDGSQGSTEMNGHIIELDRASVNYLWATSAGGSLRFVTNGELAADAAMTIDSSSNVGIGTTTPLQPLHVSGVARFSGSASNYLEIDGSDSNNNAVISNRFNKLILQTTSGQGDPHILLLPDTGGNVGIGTTTPSEKLEVRGKAIIRRTGNVTAHSDTDFLVTDATAAGSTAQMEIIAGNAANSNLYFGDTDSYSRGGFQYSHATDSMNIRAGGSTAIHIASDGDIGIGTTTPTADLHLFKNDPTINIGDSSALTRSAISSSITISDSTGAVAFTLSQSGVNTSLRSHAGDLTLGTFANASLLKLDGGNVVIGGTSASHKFIVRNNANTSNMFVVRDIGTETRIGIGTSSPSTALEFGSYSSRIITGVGSMRFNTTTATKITGSADRLYFNVGRGYYFYDSVNSPGGDVYGVEMRHLRDTTTFQADFVLNVENSDGSEPFFTVKSNKDVDIYGKTTIAGYLYLGNDLPNALPIIGSDANILIGDSNTVGGTYHEANLLISGTTAEAWNGNTIAGSGGAANLMIGDSNTITTSSTNYGHYNIISGTTNTGLNDIYSMFVLGDNNSTIVAGVSGNHHGALVGSYNQFKGTNGTAYTYEFGIGLRANQVGTFVCGVYNTTPSTQWNGTDNTGTTAGSGNLNDGSFTRFVVGNGKITGNGVGIASDALKVLQSGLVTADSLTEALIDAETTGKVLTTKEWVESHKSFDRINVDATVTGTHDIVWSDYETHDLTLTGNTTITDSGYPPSGYSKVLTLYIKGNHTLTLPTNWTTNIIGEYDQAASLNQVVVEYISSGKYWVTISQGV